MSVSMVAATAAAAAAAAILPRWSLSVMGPFLFARFSLLLSLSVASIPVLQREIEGEGGRTNGEEIDPLFRVSHSNATYVREAPVS